jgi:hypothetical protein
MIYCACGAIAIVAGCATASSASDLFANVCDIASARWSCVGSHGSSRSCVVGLCSNRGYKPASIASACLLSPACSARRCRAPTSARSLRCRHSR